MTNATYINSFLVLIELQLGRQNPIRTKEGIDIHDIGHYYSMISKLKIHLSRAGVHFLPE